MTEGQPFGLPHDDAFDRDALALAEESAGVGVWTIDLATQRVRGTAQFFRIMGLPPTSDSVPLEFVRALRHPEDRERVAQGFPQAIEGGSDSYEIEYRVVRPDGTTRWIFRRGRVIRAPDGTPQRCCGVDLDITDRKRTEAALAAATEEIARMNRELEQRVRERTAALELEAARRTEAELRLHQAQKMEAVGQLAGGIAHDFNNLLQVIIGNLEIVRMQLARDPLPAPRGEFITRAIETAQRASQTAKQTVHRLLAFSRLQPLAPAPELDLNTLVEDLADMVRRVLGESIEVDTALAPSLWPTFADRNQVESMLLNLVVNARDAMPRGGRLSIETSNAYSRPDIAGAPEGEYVCLVVRDTGHGIAGEHLSRVFEPFFTTKEPGQGSGLGLSMVHGIVKQSGGHVRIDSEVGRGTTIRILRPRSRRSAPTREEPRAAERAAVRPTARSDECILLVEDDEDVRRFGVSALEELGYRVIAEPDARSALRTLAADGERVDLLFTDVVLPGGMSGRDLAEAFREQRSRTPVLFASGYTRNVVMPEGNAQLLHKPYTIEALAAAVRGALDAAAQQT
jgi:PAS domain S-box-containing protein